MLLRIVLVILLSSCSSLAFGPKRSDPPPLGNCVLGPTGGGQCTDSNGVASVKLPTDLVNWIAFDPNQWAAYDAWCVNAGTNATPALGVSFH
jgi:hypothetical protein